MYETCDSEEISFSSYFLLLSQNMWFRMQYALLSDQWNPGNWTDYWRLASIKNEPVKSGCKLCAEDIVHSISLDGVLRFNIELNSKQKLHLTQELYFFFKFVDRWKAFLSILQTLKFQTFVLVFNVGIFLCSTKPFINFRFAGCFQFDVNNIFICKMA